MWHKFTTMWKALWGQSHHGDNPTTSKITFDNIKEVFLAKEWNSFHLSEKNQSYLHLEDFLKYKCESYLKQPLTPPQYARSLPLTTPCIIDLPMKLDNIWLSLFLEILDYATFALMMWLKMRHHLCWSITSTMPLEMTFNHYFKR